MKKLLLSALSALTVLFATNVSASTLTDTEAGMAVTGFGDPLGNSGFTVGWTFNLTETRTISHFGIYGSQLSDGSNNFDLDREIGLWDEAGNLLTSVTIPAGASGAEFEAIVADRGFFYSVLGTGVSVGPGQEYTIAARYDGGSAPGTFYNNTFSMASGVVYGNSVFDSAGAALSKPTTVDTTYPDGWVGPNFRLETTTPIPLPAALPMLLAALGGFGLVARRRNS
ncbi:VPLPA-CTERM sorting domain-containing protein [Tateyamaria sp. Alg231-49]|uniref:VPLPA-CTERM sorting domain-containing protein n=1 Tax=Tateyamaria sp. Alg231-49 TaxID=1922219 RepID=UPI000D54F6F9|nr:VPLPA-CTERM sorting domain-containing protein [Tateyamaria sp. Alg231-49]